MPVVLSVLVRAVGEPALAFDLNAETMAAAARDWEAFGGGSRTAWLLEIARGVIGEAARQRRVPEQERRRNRSPEIVRLGDHELEGMAAAATLSVDLDAEARKALLAIDHELPPPSVLADIALSSLVSRLPRRPSTTDA